LAVQFRFGAMNPVLIDLCSIPGVTQARLRNLLVHYRDPEKIMAAPENELTQIKGIAPELARQIRHYRRDAATTEKIRRAEELKCDVVSFLDGNYPANLRTIDHAPPLLFVRGRIVEQDRLAVGVIGTRRATPYGMMVAQRFARALAAHGVTVVSGLARGIDTAAHIGAMAGKGRTIAVLGCGVDVHYPPENARYYDQIAENGAVVSEFGLGTQPEAFHFPVRNRIISGLSRAILAVEARDSSGVLNTVRWAADQGREVLAIPGSINSETSSGTNELIKDGAKPVTRVEDILEYLNIQPSPQQPPVPALTEADQELLKYLSESPIHVDELALQAKQPMPVLVGRLLELEMKGVIRQLPGMMFVREFGG
jgi:DNA processing protein